MATSNGYRPPTQRELESEDWRLNHIRGRRYCEVHSDQQMMPLAPGLDLCPLPHGEGESPS
ncbi:hypothetical protein [Streptomyces sp. NPDC055013]